MVKLVLNSKGAYITYKTIGAYKFPDDVDEWLECPVCNVKPKIWVFDNGKSTGCGCGENEYRHFSIVAESIASYIKRNNGSLLGYKSDELKHNWNHWVKTGEIICVLPQYDDNGELSKW